MIAENLRRVQERIAAAARLAGRDPAGIRLIAVTKGVPVERIREAVACGVTEIGENRVQEAQEKRQVLGTVPFGDRDGSGTVPFGDSPQVAPMTWHLIGHLQKNKAGRAVELFDVIHSVDSIELVQVLERQAVLRQAQDERPCRRAQGERRLEVLIQVNVSGEATQHGCRPEEVEGLAEAILQAKHLKFAGLMTLAPFFENPERARPVFGKLRELRDRLEKQGGDCFVPLRGARNDGGRALELSMGMSHDFEAAMREGATMLRIGAAIFGQ